MLEIAAAQEGFEEGLRTEIGFVRSLHNLADDRTKCMHQAAIRSVMQGGRLKAMLEQ